MAKPYQHFLKTRYVETAQDQIIHHSAYVIYMETARLEFMKERGCDINQLEKQGINCPVVELSMNYRKPLYSQEDLVIYVSVDVLSKVRFQIRHEIFRGDDCVAIGQTLHCFTNRAFKPVPIPSAIYEGFLRG